MSGLLGGVLDASNDIVAGGLFGSRRGGAVDGLKGMVWR